MATKVCTLPSVTKTFVFVDEGWFWLYVADAPKAVNDRYIEQVLYKAYTDQVGVPINMAKLMRRQDRINL